MPLSIRIQVLILFAPIMLLGALSILLPDVVQKWHKKWFEFTGQNWEAQIKSEERNRLMIRIGGVLILIGGAMFPIVVFFVL